MKLTEKQIIDFIENYGNDDVYWSYEKTNDDTYYVKYVPMLKKVVSEESLPLALEELKNPNRNWHEAIRTIVLRKDQAFILNANKKTDTTLIKNYGRFLRDQQKNNSNYEEFSR